MFKYIRNESGQTMVLVALMIFVLLGFGALAIDVGAMTYQRSNLQNAADSAALAGAILAPQNYEPSVVKQKMINEYAKNNFNKIQGDDLAEDDIIIDKNNKTVEIKIKQNVPKYFGGILSNQTKEMTVHAKAKYISHSEAEVLPFVNVNDLYTIGSDTTITVWEKDVDKSGYFESIEKNNQVETNYVNKHDPALQEDIYIKILDFEDGIRLTPGVDASIEDPLYAYVYKDITKNNKDRVVDIGRILYVFSLKNNVISSNKYFQDNTSKNEDVDFEDLVLLKVELRGFYENMNNEENARIVLKVLDAYDLSAGDIPAEGVITIKSESSLIE